MSGNEVLPDLDFLKAGHLCYALTVLQNERCSEDKDLIVKKSRDMCALMEKYRVLHPRAPQIVALLEEFDPETEYNGEWLRGENRFVSSENVIAKVVNSVFTNTSQFKDMEGDISRLILAEAHEDAQGMLRKFQNMVQFSSQPRTQEDLKSNNYNRFYFYLYCVFSRKSLVFQKFASQDEEKEGDRYSQDVWPKPYPYIPKDAPRSEQNGCENVMLKVTRYYEKNEKLLKPNESHLSSELIFFWLIRIMNLTYLFSKLSFRDFLEEFNELMKIEVPSNYLEYKPSKLIANGIIVPKDTITIMYEFSMLISKPSKSLSLKETEEDLRTADELILNSSGFPNHVYYNTLLPLSKLDYKSFKDAFETELFLKSLDVHIGFYLASLRIRINVFYSYAIIMVLSKGFVLIMSMSKKIPKGKLMNNLGCSEDDEVVFNSLIYLMGILCLGDLGLGYDYHKQIFYRQDVDNVESNLLEEFESVSRKIESESIATLFKEVLVEKYIND